MAKFNMLENLILQVFIYKAWNYIFSSGGTKV